MKKYPLNYRLCIMTCKRTARLGSFGEIPLSDLKYYVKKFDRVWIEA